MPTESKQTYSPEVIQEAAQLAKKVKAPQQTKEQTKWKTEQCNTQRAI